MLIPDNVPKIIAKVFYDKTITIVNLEREIEADGGTGDFVASPKLEFKGNIQFKNLEKILDDYGLKYNVKACITCPIETIVHTEDVIEYMGLRYFVKDVLPFDTHKKILLDIWKAFEGTTNGDSL